MTRAGRALLGAALGAALTLLIHPASRPYLFSVFLSPTHTTAAQQSGIPTTLTGLSDWMIAIGERYNHRRLPNKIELGNALLAAEEGARRDPQNAFWMQMVATLDYQLGQQEDAKRAWVQASRLNRWSDYQTPSLLKEERRLSDDFGAEQSWQLAYVYYQRNPAAVNLIDTYSRWIARSTPLDTTDGLLLRTASVINGSLLRQGCQSVPIGNIGAGIAEAACQPPQLAATINRHKLHLARVNMQDRLRKLGHEDLADQVAHVYREADAWDAFIDTDSAMSEVTEQSLISLLYVGLPGIMIPVAVIGIALWLLGHALRGITRVHLLPAGILGLLLALLVYGITYLPLAACATFLCCVFLTVTPKRERAGVKDLGPMFSFTAGTLGLGFTLLIGAFILGISAPAVSVLPYLQIPTEYFGGSGVLLGLAIIVLAILLLLAPFFAIALRVGTAAVLSRSLKAFGTFLVGTALLSVVVGSPLCIYFDRQNSDSLRRLVTNEPLYYLNLAR